MRWAPAIPTDFATVFGLSPNTGHSFVHESKVGQQRTYVSSTLDFPADWLPTYHLTQTPFVLQLKKIGHTTASCGMSSSPPT